MTEDYKTINAGNKAEIARKLKEKGGAVIHFRTYQKDSGYWRGSLDLFDTPIISKSLDNLVIISEDKNSRRCDLEYTPGIDSSVPGENIKQVLKFQDYTFIIKGQDIHKKEFIISNGGNLYVPCNPLLEPALEEALFAMINQLNANQQTKNRGLKKGDVQNMVKAITQDLEISSD